MHILVRAPHSLGPAPGADLGGRTALLLLTPGPASGTTLFLSSEREGVVAIKSGEQRFYPICFKPDAIPFESGSFASVILDIDRTGLRQRVRSRLIREAYRVLAPGGRCVIVASGRRFPRDRRDWQRYHLWRADRRWSKLLASDRNFTISDTMTLRVDRDRIVELCRPEETPAKEKKSPGDRSVTVLRRRDDSEGRALLERAIAEFQSSLDPSSQSVRLERVLIRKIGKTTAIIVADDERRYVMRMPRSPMAAERGRRNFEALKTIHATNLLPDHLKAMVPRARLAGVLDRDCFYVEEALPGTPRDDYHSWPYTTGWEPGALRFISEMHFATKRTVKIDRKVFDHLVATPLSRIRNRCPTRETNVFDRLRTALERRLLGETLPLVWSHGDFAAGNCLYDASRRLSAVVDWELFSAFHLPLLDVLHCMEIPDERNSSSTWQRFDAIREMLQTERLLARPPLASYVEQIGLSPHVLPALMLMYWVDHVSERIDGRFDDAVWMAKKVFAPLSSLASVELT